MKKYALAILFFFAGSISAHAAGPLFLTSWKSFSYAPAWYEGKIFPTNGSVIKVFFEAVEQGAADKGKIINLKKNEIRWYVNDRLVARGNGIQSLEIKNEDFPGSQIGIKISAQFFDSDTQETYFSDTYFTIPIVSPSISLLYDNFYRSLASNADVTVRAAPFFFNVPDALLRISWLADGKSVPFEGFNPLLLNLRVGQSSPGRSVTVKAAVQNPENSFERTEKSISFTLQ